MDFCPEERIRIRNLLVDFSENRTVLFSTHVVEEASGHVWSCEVEDEKEIGELERKYHISSRQYTERGIRIRVISERRPGEMAREEEATLEDGYLYLMEKEADKTKKTFQ